MARDAGDSQHAITDYLTRWGALDAVRQNYWAHWKELNQFFQPRSGRFLPTDKNQKGGRQNRHIYDGSPTYALRILASGLMSGVTSPARPWFKVKLADPDLNRRDDVIRWCARVTTAMLGIMARTNTYRAFYSMYQELGLYGTAACPVVDDPTVLIRHMPQTIGQYAIANNDRNEVDTFYREFMLSTKQMVQQFGLANVSDAVRSAYTSRTNLTAEWPVLHVIEPRALRDTQSQYAKDMAFTSCYFEKAQHNGRFLLESGFRTFPVLTPRWETVADDTYGSSPAMDALGDAKQLQHQQLRKAQGIDFQTKPPILLPASLKGAGVDILPGGVVYGDTSMSGRNLMDVRMDLSHLTADIEDVRQRIRSIMFTDLFLALLSTDNPQMTAREVAERHEEKLLMLGPVLERLENEMFAPQIDIMFARMVEVGMLRGALAPPDAVQGQTLELEFVGLLAQAQKAAGVQNVNQWLGVIGAIAGFKQDIVDKVAADAIADQTAEMYGIDPEMVVANDQVALIRNQRAQQQQAAASLAAATQASQAMKNVGITAQPGM